MTREENWKLVLRICEEMKDEVIASVRIGLLNDFGKTDDYASGDNFRQILSTIRTFRPLRKRLLVCQVPQHKLAILIPATSGSNVLNLLPVAQEAKRRGLLGGIIAAESFHQTGSKVLSEFDNVVSELALRSQIGPHFLPGSMVRASRRFRRLVRKINQHDSLCAKRVRQNFGYYLKWMVTSEAMSVAYRQLFAAWRPSCLLSTSDYWPAEFQCCRQAKLLGIPTTILQHGVITNPSIWPTYHDTFLAWGETFRTQLIERGASPDRILIGGMPSSDSLFNHVSSASKCTSPVCLVFSHTQDRVEESALFEDFGRCLIEAISASPRIIWKIKLHPAEDDSFYAERGIARFKNVEILPRNISLEQAVDNASVVLTIRSTAGLQAMMLKKPLLVFYSAMLKEPPVRWPEEGGGIYMRDAKDLTTNIEEMENNPAFARNLLASQESFLAKTFANRGKASSAIIDLLTDLGRRDRRNEKQLSVGGVYS
jgi:hypothetical protein